MSKIYYIEDPNGTIMSENGQRRFRKLEGTKAFEFLNTPEGKTCRFMKVCDYEESDDEVYIEVSSEYMKDFRKYERREQYVSDTIKSNEYVLVSMNAMEKEDGEEETEECIADEDINIELDFIHQCELETLRKALRTLSEEELALITALYLQEEPMTEREYAGEIGIPQKTLNDRKNRLLKKIKSFF